MEVWEISLLIIAIAVVLLIAFLIPALIQLRSSIQQLEKVTKKVDSRLPKILENVEQISTNVNDITQSGKDQVQTLGSSVNQIRSMVDDVVQIEQNIKSKVDHRLINSISTLSAGVKAAQVFFNVMKYRNSKDNENINGSMNGSTRRKKRFWKS